MTEFLILRHAPTAWNAEKRIQGRTDVPLSAEGLALARRWRVPAFARAWACRTSPLARAVATATAMGLDPSPLDALTEMDWGALEGRRLADIRAEGGAAFAAAEAKGLDFRPGGGESPREVGLRALAGLAALASPTVVVTHKGVLRALFAIATGWDMRAKAPVRLADGCAHHFRLDAVGHLHLVEAGIALAPPIPAPYPGDAASGPGTAATGPETDR